MFASSSPSYRLINGNGADTFRNKVHISYENHLMVGMATGAMKMLTIIKGMATQR